MIDFLVEKTKENQTFRGDYMAWGLAEQDAEKRGYNADVADGISQGISQEQIAKGTGLSLEMLQSLAREWGITPNVRDKFKDSFLTEYDYDTDIAVQREEAAEQAKIETARNMLLENLPIDLVVRTTGLPLETIQKLAECK